MVVKIRADFSNNEMHSTEYRRLRPPSPPKTTLNCLRYLVDSPIDSLDSVTSSRQAGIQMM